MPPDGRFQLDPQKAWNRTVSRKRKLLKEKGECLAIESRLVDNRERREVSYPRLALQEESAIFSCKADPLKKSSSQDPTPRKGMGILR